MGTKEMRVMIVMEVMRVVLHEVKCKAKINSKRIEENKNIIRK